MGKADKKLANKVPNSIKRNIPKLRYLWAMLQFISLKSSLHKLGWFKSAWKEESINADGKPIPWITYPAIYFLESRVNKSMRVYEYGSGNSTKWWAEKCKSVTAVDDDQYWQKKVQNLMPKNAKVIYRPLGEGYYNSILDQKGNFDVVIVDGRMRVECAKAALTKLSKDGVIIWDNTDRQRYQTGIRYLEKQGFKHIDFYGPMPIDNMVSLTSVFYKNKNVLKI